MPRTILITGATSGIGEACARQFAAVSDRLILSGRRNSRLEALTQELTSSFHSEIFPLTFDIRNQAEVKHALDSLPESWKQIDILVNNAGLAVGLNPVQDGLTEDWERMIDTNVKGLLYVTRQIAPGMIARGTGHIINIGSIAGKEVYPNGNVYCATKFAVDALTKGMRIDMLPYGIKVSQVCPGAVETEFSEVRFKGDTERASRVYEGYTPLSADDIASAIVWLAGLPPHVNVNDMVIVPTAQASPAYHYKHS
jgi:hypothetical protein